MTKIFVVSGQSVKAGQVLMQIDPLKQVAAVEQQVGDAGAGERLVPVQQGGGRPAEEAVRCGDHFAGRRTTRRCRTSRTRRGRYEASSAGTATQKQQLAYYQIRAPFAGVVGDIPVHLGDYVSPNAAPSTVLTTIDEIRALRLISTSRPNAQALVKMGLPVDILDTDG